MTSQILALLLALSSTATYASHLNREQEDPATANSRESYGHNHNRVFSDDVNGIQKHYTRPHETWLKSEYMFLGSQRILLERSTDSTPSSLHMLSSDFGDLQIPAEMFARLHDQIKAMLMKRLRLTESLAEAVAVEIETQALATAKVDTKAYHALFPRDASPATPKDVMEFLSANFPQPSLEFDIPFVAGYALNDGTKIYIDRSFRESVPLADGRKYPIVPLLETHEMIEKAVLDEFETTYPHAHQIALRIEEAACAASGYDWKIYDDYMQVKIDAIGKVLPKQVPPDLDFTPYYAYTDADSRKLVEEMKAAQVQP